MFLISLVPVKAGELSAVSYTFNGVLLYASIWNKVPPVVNVLPPCVGSWIMSSIHWVAADILLALSLNLTYAILCVVSKCA